MDLKKEQFKELLEEYTFNINEQDVFNWFKIRRRFPHEFHTQSPSVEVINSYDGESKHRGLFDSEGYVDEYKILKVQYLMFLRFILLRAICIGVNQVMEDFLVMTTHSMMFL
jgi:hypothetical protein